VPAQVQLVDVHDCFIPGSDAIREAKALVEVPSAEVGLIDADLDRVGVETTGFAQHCFHDGPPEPATAHLRPNVELCEAALKVLAPDRRPQPQHGDPVRPVVPKKDDGVSTIDESRETPRESLDRRGRLAELSVEVKKELRRAITISGGRDPHPMLDGSRHGHST
jgi:hypothetical protein